MHDAAGKLDGLSEATYNGSGKDISVTAAFDASEITAWKV
jgi:hypothetical protein